MGYTVAVFLLKLHLCAVCSKSLYTNGFCSKSVFLSPTKFPRYPTNAINYVVLSCERLIILVTQTVHENRTQKLEHTWQRTAQDRVARNSSWLRGWHRADRQEESLTAGVVGRAEGSLRRRRGAGCDVTRARRRRNAVGISKVGLLKICV